MSEIAETGIKRAKLAGDEEGQGTAETSKEAEKVRRVIFSFRTCHLVAKPRVKSKHVLYFDNLSWQK